MTDTISILLVDDEQRNLDALEAILDEPGYRLLRADDADKALRILLDHDVAAIVLDIKMPGVSGVELARMIKGTRRFRQIPIVFLTAYLVDDQDVLAGYGAGAVDYLTKPVNPQILRHKVGVFADLFRKTRALAELNEHLELRVQERTAELEQSEALLRAANDQKDRFLATLAHELRNPLAPLRTGVDLLLQEAEPSAATTRTLAIMDRQVDHMVRLIDDLLDVSRIHRGTLEMRKSDAELLAVIDRAIETVGPLLARRRQSATVDAQGPLTARVDGTRIAQIVGNLLHNASKHSPPDASIRVELRREKDNAVIRVIDDGVGIPSGQLARVFDMFTKVERSRPGTEDGLGIGLALSRQLAVLHGGTLSADSRGEGTGATFCLSVPIGASRSAVDVPARIAPVVPRPASGLRIVLVEDNDDSADMLSTWLEASHHEVRVAHTGPDGVAAVLEVRPDVVLCDIGLPGCDGIDVCRQVLLGMVPPPVMVALTGWGMEGNRRRTDEAGFRHHLVKPVALDELRALLDTIGRAAREPRSGTLA